MSTRSQPAVIAAIAARMGGAQADVKPAEFAQHSCEVAEAAALRAQPAPGAVVQSFATHPGFGCASLDRRPTGWSLTAWSLDGQALKRCDIEGQRLHCGP